MEERTASEEREGVPWEQQAEETEHHLEKVGCVVTSVISTCDLVSGAVDRGFPNPPGKTSRGIQKASLCSREKSSCL